MRKRPFLAITLITVFLIPAGSAQAASAQAACVKKQLYCKKVAFKPSGTEIYFALSKKSLDKKRTGRFALMAYALQADDGSVGSVIGKVRVATGFKLSSKVKKVTILTPGDDDASVIIKFRVTPSVGTVTYNLALSPNSISLAG